VSEHAPAVHHAPAGLMPWAQIAIFLVTQICGLVYFITTVKDNQTSLERQMDSLSTNVRDVGTQVGRLASVYERLD
jgi:hypothetical protein